MRDCFLKTDRITFSHWTRHDYSLALLLWGDELVTQYITRNGKFSEDEIEKRLQLEVTNQQRFKVQYWPIFLKETDDFIGCCGLRPFDIENSVYEIGFHLRSEHWGKGLAPEAAKAVMQYAAKQMKARELIAGHHPDNINSGKVLEKLGFQYIGSNYYEPTGLYHPSYKCVLCENFS